MTHRPKGQQPSAHLQRWSFHHTQLRTAGRNQGTRATLRPHPSQQAASQRRVAREDVLYRREAPQQLRLLEAVRLVLV